MAKTMKAFVMKRVGEVGVMEKAVPDPGPNDAIVKTTAALICTSDTHTAAGAIGERTNLTLGHEAVGVVYKLGSAVAGFKEGDRVAVSAITPCYQCENCLRVTHPGTVSYIGYHGDGDYVQIPRLDWGVGMGDKTIRTRLCPGGAERMKRSMRLIAMGRMHPRPLTSHRFPFGEVEKDFRMMQTKEDGMLEPLIPFEGGTSREGDGT